YSLGTEYALARFAERWGHDTLRELLTQNARFPVRAQLERLRGLAEAGLQRELAPGLRLEGHVEAFTPLGVYAEGDGFVVRGQAAGCRRSPAPPARRARAAARSPAPSSRAPGRPPPRSPAPRRWAHRAARATSPRRRAPRARAPRARGRAWSCPSPPSHR